MSIQTLKSLGLGTALLATPSLSFAAASPNAPSKLLAAAQTIQFQETLQRSDGGSPLSPIYHVAVNIKRPGVIKMVIKSEAGPRTDQYVSDGSTEYEYDGGSQNYKLTPLVPGQKSKSQIRGITALELVLGNGVVPPPAPGSQRIVTTERVEAQEMTVTTDTDSITLADKSKIGIIGKIWSDAKTRLPVRLTAVMVQKGVTKTLEDLKFSGWVFNKPIPAEQLAWIPPAGAKLFSEEPVLLPVGTVAPDFTAVMPDGKTVHLSDYKGKTLILDFWATWCGPCQKSMPHLEKVYQSVKSQNVAVLGLCVWDQKSFYDKWVTEKASTYTFQTAYDPAGHAEKNIAGSLYKVTGIPTQYVIDKDGKVAAAYTGYDDKDDRLEKALTAQGVTLPTDPKTTAAK